jgi:hypothetical protein
VDRQTEQQGSEGIALLYTAGAGELAVPKQKNRGSTVTTADKGKKAGETQGNLVQERLSRDAVEGVLEIELQKLEVRLEGCLLVQ